MVPRRLFLGLHEGRKLTFTYIGKPTQNKRVTLCDAQEMLNLCCEILGKCMETQVNVIIQKIKIFPFILES